MEKTQGRKLAGAAVIVMSSIIISRLTGFLRAALIPNMLGSNMETDAFYLAFRITDLMFNLLIGGAISSALIPVLSAYIARKDEEEGWQAVSTFINVTFLAMAGLSLLGILFSPRIVDLMGSSFTPEQKLLTVRLTRILFPSVCFIMLAGLTNGVLNSYQRFAAAAYGPAIYNLGSALSIFLLSRYGVEWVAFGVMCSAAVYFLFQFSFAFRNFRYYRMKIHFHHEGFRRLFRLAIPSLLSSSIMQVNVLVSTAYTTLLAAGSLTAYTMANDTWQLPFGVFAMGIGMAILPTLSRQFALGKMEEYKAVIEKALRMVLLLTIPSGAALIVLREPVIAAIYKWTGKVNVVMAGNVLAFFSIALLSHSSIAILNRAFYARNDTRTPLLVGGSTILFNALLSNLFVRFTPLGASGMSLAYSIAGLANAIMLLVILNRKLEGIHIRQLLSFLLRVAVASSVMAAVLFLLNDLLPVDFSWKLFSLKTKAKALLVLLVEVTAGTLVYFGMVLAMRLQEGQYLLALVKEKLKNRFLRRNGENM